jgi:hypothetical protein
VATPSATDNPSRTKCKKRKYNISTAGTQPLDPEKKPIEQANENAKNLSKSKRCNRIYWINILFFTKNKSS